MNNYVFPPPAVVALPVKGQQGLFPVRRVYCVGRNYEAHVSEMGHDPARTPPMFFCKPADAVVPVSGERGSFPYPSRTADCHHEIELVVAIGRGGRDIPPELACGHVFGYAIGLDMTRRDLQRAAAQAGQPWEIGKAFDHSAPVGPIHPASETGPFRSGAISLSVGGQARQRSDVSQLIWSVDEMISELSSLFELHPGDLIFSGTPEGVGPVRRGDLMEGAIDRLGRLQVEVI